MDADKQLMADLLMTVEDYLQQVVRHLNPNGDGIAPSVGHRAAARTAMLDALMAVVEASKGRP